MQPTVLLPLGGTNPSLGRRHSRFCKPVRPLACCVFTGDRAASVVRTLTVRAGVLMMDDHQRLLAVKEKPQRADLTHSTIRYCFPSQVHSPHSHHPPTWVWSPSFPTLKTLAFTLHCVPTNKSSQPSVTRGVTRVLPLSHLGQALLVTLHPADTVAPTCRAKQANDRSTLPHYNHTL